ncbi:MAG TPA: S9 family peptidase [Thermoanaerobaculia bacterium]|nr:S9 family peptidase [Thermoanaerobaculia bacterium]
MKSTSRLAAALLALGGLAAGPAAPPRRPIAETDLLKLRWIADPQISPDGRQIAYVLVTVNEKEDRYDTALWTVAASEGAAPRPLTSGPRDSAPRWAPDSHTLAFLRSPEKGAPQVYLLSMSGGEARMLTDLPKGTSAPVWSPDGKAIAFTSGTTPEDLEEKKRGAKADRKKSDVHLVTEAFYRLNGLGLIDPSSHDHVWTVPSTLPANGPAEARQLTAGKFDEGSPVWSPDGSRLYFASDPVAESYYYPSDSNVYAVPASGGPIDRIVDIDGPVLDVSPSPDGRRFAFHGWINPERTRSYDKVDLFVSDGRSTRDLTADWEADLTNFVAYDTHPPRGGGDAEALVWTPDGAAFFAVATVHGAANLFRVDAATGARQPVTAGDREIVAFSATPDASRFALTIDDGAHPGELYVLDAATRRLTRLTGENDALLAEIDVSVPEKIVYPSFDGTKIEAWVVKPPRFDPKKKYPLILNIHGGPHIEYGETFFHEFQWMAARGYVVLAPNPRGSASYGQEFANSIQYEFPGIDYKDLMAGVDELIRRGYVDEKRLGITGGSGGGVLTNWTITQTGRFKAAVSQRSIADWAGWWYDLDVPIFTPAWFRKFPFQDPDEYRRRSPVSYAERVTTPYLTIEGESDLRAPTDSGGGAMFRALKALHKTAAMVLFPGETHELSRSGRPSHRIERLRYIVGWFDKYMEGKSVAEFP